MRLPVIAPNDLPADQKQIYDRIKQGIGAYLTGFVTERSDGGLIGPFTTWLSFPKIGGPLFDFFSALNDQPTLPPKAREIVILLTGAHLNALFETYSHEAVAKSKGMTPEQIYTLAAGEKPEGLTEDEALVFTITRALLRGATLPASTYAAGVDRLGTTALAEIACLIGCYTAVSSLLNTFDYAIPQTEGADPDPTASGRSQ